MIGQASIGFDLSGQRARAGHHFGLVVGVHEQRAAGLLALQAGGQRVGIRSAADDHFSAQLGQCLALGSATQFRQKDFAPNAQSTCRFGHRNARVAA